MNRRLNNLLFHLLLVVLLGLSARLLHRYDQSWDLSADQRNALHVASATLASQLDGPLAITAFIAEQAPQRRRIEQLVARYRVLHPQTSLHFVDPSLHPEQARRLGIQRHGELLVEYGGNSRKIARAEEALLSDAIARLAQYNTGWIVGINGHGESSLDGKANQDLGRLGQALKQQGFQLGRVNLLDGRQVPNNTALLVLAAPRQPLAAPETDAIIEYLETGGELLWLAAGELPQPLLDYLELSSLPGTVVDAAAADLGIDSATIAVSARHPHHAITRHLEQPVLLPGSRALKTLAAPQRWQPSPLLQSSSRSWNETSEIGGILQRDPQLGEERGPLTLGFALEREHKDTGQQRVVVIGGSDFLSNAYLGNGANRAFGLSLTQWLTANEALVNIPPRQAMDLDMRWSQGVLAMLAGLFMVLLPLLLAGSGMLIYLLRRRRT